MNMPFNDFANTTQDGYRAIFAAFCFVPSCVDWANPSMFHVAGMTPVLRLRFIIHLAMWLADIFMNFALMPSAPVAMLGSVNSS